MSASGGLRINRGKYLRRRAIDAIMGGLCLLAALLGLVVLALILWTLVQKGLAGLSPGIFFKETAPTTGANGGLANAIVGSLLQVGLGALIGAPLGIGVGVYLAEVGKNSPFASVVRFVNDILLSAPSVLIGLFIYQIMVLPMHSASAIAGAIALALIAMPVIARTTEDIIRLIPDGYRDGSIALGARNSVTILKVILPAASGGILTGILLAIARISGETAPLIFTSFGNWHWNWDLTRATGSLPLAIYQLARYPSKDLVNLAWTGALLITFGVLALNIASRVTLYFTSKGKHG